MNTKMFGILAMVLVAFAGTGVAFGHWVSTVYVNGIVTSGSFNIVVSDEGINTCCPEWVHVSSVVNSATNTVTENITNAFPGVAVWGQINLNNTGTVPGSVDWCGFCMTANDIEYPGAPVTASDEAWTNITGCFASAGSAVWNDTTGNVGGVPPTTQQWIVYWWWTDASGNNITFHGMLYPDQTVYFNYKIVFLEGLEQSETWLFNVTIPFVASCGCGNAGNNGGD